MFAQASCIAPQVHRIRDQGSVLDLRVVEISCTDLGNDFVDTINRDAK